MGAEATCSAKYGRQSSEGKALLETSELLFRGAFRLKIPFAEITSLEAKAGRLKIVFSGGSATFELGDKAEKWAAKIKNPPSLLDKLGVKAGQRIVVLAVDDRAFASQLAASGADVRERAGKDADIVFYRAETLRALDRLSKLREAIKRDGAIWTITPKGKTGIKDTHVMAKGKAAGLVDVKVAAFSATHSALKFVIPNAAR